MPRAGTGGVVLGFLTLVVVLAVEAPRIASATGLSTVLPAADRFLWLLLSGVVLVAIGVRAKARRSVLAQYVARNGRSYRPTVGFLHLDMGLGGAERLVLDAALALQSAGHEVEIATTAHRVDHCFPETLPSLAGSTKGGSGASSRGAHVPVVVRGAWVPHRVLGRAQGLMGALRMCVLAFLCGFQQLFGGGVFAFDGFRLWDVVIVDGVSACVPVLRLFGALLGFRVLFYCHFPDKLLVRDRGGVVRSLYRMPLDFVEERTTAMAHRVVVNSNFTRQTFVEAFTAIKVLPEVVYPAVNIAAFDRLLKASEPRGNGAARGDELPIPDSARIVLSVNRFDALKRVEVAVRAFCAVRTERIKNRNLQLVVAGGYDVKVRENVEYLRRLEGVCEGAGLESAVFMPGDRRRPSDESWWPQDAAVVFLPDVSEKEKVQLLSAAEVLVYTPTGEHFGIVPCEAMLARTPVVAARSGGLLETVREDSKVGLLCKPGDTESFAGALEVLIREPVTAKQMGERGRQRVEAEFSRTRLQRELTRIVCELSGVPVPEKED